MTCCCLFLFLSFCVTRRTEEDSAVSPQNLKSPLIDLRLPDTVLLFTRMKEKTKTKTNKKKPKKLYYNLLIGTSPCFTVPRSVLVQIAVVYLLCFSIKYFCKNVNLVSFLCSNRKSVLIICIEE